MSKNPFEDAARAEDLSDLLQHIAWTDTLHPALVRQRDNYAKMLVGAVLGRPVEIRSGGGVIHTLTKEQLAGRIDGIDYVLDIIEKILAKGSAAVLELRNAGISLAQREL